MLQRYVHNTGSATGTIEVTDLDTGFLAAISASETTSFAAESAGTASIDVTAFFATGSIVAVTQSFNGLVFRDQFNRPDSGSPENGWQLDIPSASILDNFLHFPSTETVVMQRNSASAGEEASSFPSLPASHIVQSNMVAGASDAFPRIMTAFNSSSTPGGNDLYDWGLDVAGNQLELRDIRDSALEQDNNAAQTVNVGAIFTMRMVVETTATQSLLRGYSGSAASLGDLTASLVQRTSFTDDPRHTGSFYGFDPSRSGSFDEFFVCGRDVAVSGLPISWSVRLNNTRANTTRSAAETAGAVTIDIDTFELPYDSIEILDDADVVRTTLIPTQSVAGFETGGYGGDTFAVGVSAARFDSLHVLSGSISVPVTTALLTGSFISGNIFGGDKYRYIESSTFAVMGLSSSMFQINVTQSIIPSGSFARILSPDQPTGAAAPAAPTVPTEGQIFPRGKGGN